MAALLMKTVGIEYESQIRETQTKKNEYYL